MTTKEFIKRVGVYEFMMTTNDIAIYDVVYSDEEISEIAGDYDHGFKDEDTLTEKQCYNLISNFMYYMNEFYKDVLYKNSDFFAMENEVNWYQGRLDCWKDLCNRISANVKGFKRYFDKQQLAEINRLTYVKSLNYDGYDLIIGIEK